MNTAKFLLIFLFFAFNNFGIASETMICPLTSFDGVLKESTHQTSCSNGICSFSNLMIMREKSSKVEYSVLVKCIDGTKKE